ncbi:HD domain-containing phosphohydrolase [Trichlorobacter ammonificans]|uniref:Response regulator receiver modulated metal dependent phosphohydrolase n=1 Tax=Trichlorobacter ammonificans TaxID=2916410 RepID=A0ABN8HFD6_9BACT|nr:HD domain-containing phosphohydrolase [Trichlorobacter ammonificans]CAH2031575.1 Response regulator receiver modulated metal dependent phosphohydrolase [Trichlorobacter ammonificans]
MDQQPQQPVSPSVLFVDDEENILKAMVRLTMDEAFSVVTATSGQQGLECLQQMPEVALIVSDQRMPGMNGAEFLHKSRELAPDAIRMLLTGYSDISAAVDAINRGGASRYLSKPWNDDDLLQTLRGAVETWELTRENRRLQAVVQAQNEELKQWNENLKSRVLQQTTAIRKKADDLNEALLHLKENYTGMISAFSSLVELRGGRMKQHSRNVAELAAHAAREYGLMPEEQETIRIAALLHDIGEIGIPERILEIAPDVLPPDEFRLYAQHPVRSQMAIDHIADLRPAGALIRHHHEQFDGNGFPDRLAGDQIPLGARILAYADQLDRAIAGGDSAEQALARVEMTLETKLDPTLQRVFRKAFHYAYPAMPAFDDQATVELELKPAELKAGMLLTRDLYSGTGLLLLDRGTVLDDSMIVSITRYYQLDPPEQGVFALIRTSQG